MKEKISALYRKPKLRLAQKIRNKAIEEAKQNLVKYGKSITELSRDQWREIVAHEEAKIKKNYRIYGISIIVGLGIIPWI